MTLMREYILERLYPLISETCRQETTPEGINEETNLIDDLLYDSVGIMELVVRIEDEFQFEFDDDALIGAFTRVADLVKYIEQKAPDNMR